jgi:lipoprotein-anchoring transpeptidase ErfK/SrfK
MKPPPGQSVRTAERLFEGTNRPELLPGRISHGCIEMRNAALLKLARLMPVGTPLTIRWPRPSSLTSTFG